MHRVADLTFGHRLMMDCVVPGGVAADAGAWRCRSDLRVLADLADGCRNWSSDNEPRLPARLSGLGVVTLHQVSRLAAGGVIGRAAGRAFDVRRSPGYGPTPHRAAGAPARRWRCRCCRTAPLRLAEIGDSIRLLRLCSIHCRRVPSPSRFRPTAARASGLPKAPEAISGTGCGWIMARSPACSCAIRAGRTGRSWRRLRRQPGGDLPLIQASFDLASSGVDL